MKRLVKFKHRSGGVWIDNDHFDPENQIFSLLENDGRIWHWHIPTLQRLIDSNPQQYQLVTIDLEPSLVSAKIKMNGITPEELILVADSKLVQPGILIIFADQEHAIIDGNHRLVKRYLDGQKTMDFWLLTEEQSRPSMIKLPRKIGQSLLAGKMEKTNEPT